MVAQRTSLGWLLFEVLTTRGSDISELTGIMNRFWESEELSLPRKQTPEEKSCEELFMRTYSKDEMGKYIVHIPLKEGIDDLGSSREVALKRFCQLERRFARDPEFKRKYVATISEYIA